MFSIRGWQRLGPRRPASPISLLDGLNSRESFRKIVERECARSDRTGHGFSLVTFNLDAEPHGANAERLGRLFAQRLRATDEVGWIDERRVGVLLYNAPAEGAWSFVQKAWDALPVSAPPPECAVYTYPNRWPTLDGKRGGPAEGIFRADASPGPLGRMGTSDMAVGQTDAGDFAAMRRGRLSSDPSGSNIVAFEAPTGAAGDEAVSLLARQPLVVGPMPRWKRTMDVVGAAAALTVCAPLMLLIAVAIKLTSRGPAVFRQQRAGLGGKPFVCYKFRSMVEGAEEQKAALMKYNERSHVAFKMENDPRITPVGRFLRRLSLDELPQFYNVLKGDMSLVGPRPLPIEEAVHQDKWHMMRMAVAPGITCLWQVYARHCGSFDDWARLDIEYVLKQSLLLDIKLLILTVPAVLSMRGAR